MLTMTDSVQNMVKQHRLKHGMTQEELATAVGVTRQTIIAIEGSNYTPSVLLALKLAKVFKSTIGKLFTMRA
jgi:putative transcriptional regulator